MSSIHIQKAILFSANIFTFIKLFSSQDHFAVLHRFPFSEIARHDQRIDDEESSTRVAFATPPPSHGFPPMLPQRSRVCRLASGIQCCGLRSLSASDQYWPYEDGVKRCTSSELRLARRTQLARIQGPYVRWCWRKRPAKRAQLFMGGDEARSGGERLGKSLSLARNCYSTSFQVDCFSSFLSDTIGAVRKRDRRSFSACRIEGALRLTS